MITKLVQDNMYVFMSSEELILKVLFAIFGGIVIGWIFTLVYFDGKRTRAIKEEYAKSLSDKEYRAYNEMRRKV